MVSRKLILPAAVTLFVLGAVGVWRLGKDSLGNGASPPADIPAVPTSAPRVVAVDNVFEFGNMKPGDKRKHKFVVRNEGTADLELKLASTTCKCTLAELDDARVPPGGSTEIELDWHAEEAQFRFRQAALIQTNDPVTKQFELAVEGSVRTELGALPASAYFPNLSRDESRYVVLRLFSENFERMEFGKLECDVPGVSCEFSPEQSLEESNKDLQIEHARWVRQFVVLKQPQVKKGPFSGVVRIPYVGYAPDGTRGSGVFELPLNGETTSDVTWQGRHVVGNTLMLGQRSRREEKTTKAYLHFRNAPKEKELDVKFTDANPKFLQVTVGKREQLSDSIARVPVEILLPKGSESVSFVGDNLGSIELTTTHPDCPRARLNVSLIVEP
ncbi:MAG: hypothetical protein C0483_01275 [Pirellula sp.]|nr:hypothetical protein [Pirellula sp.]